MIIHTPIRNKNETIDRNDIKSKTHTNIFILLLINFAVRQSADIYYTLNFDMAGLCKLCISIQERLLADGAGSQVMCDHEDTI